MIRILLVDDQNLIQEGIKSLLDRDSELQVIGTVKDGRTAVKEIEYLRPDVVLLDIEMPGMDGITTAKYINRLSPETKVIILSSHEDKKYVTQALMAGAKGYILKSSLIADLKQAIIAVNNGYSQIDSRLLAKVFDPSNLKQKKHQADNGNQAENTKKKSKYSSNGFVDETEQATKIQGSSQTKLQEDYELSKRENFFALSLDSISPQSEEYQLGSSPIDLVESETKTSIQSPPEISELEILDVEIAEAVPSDSNTLIQKDRHDFDSVEVENSELNGSSPSFLLEDSAENISNFSSFKEILPDVKPNDLDNLPKRSLLVEDRPETHTVQKVLPRTEYPQNRPYQTEARIISKEAVQSNTPLEFSSNLIKYQPTTKKRESRLKVAFKKSLKYGWVWNIALLILGAVIVIIIGSL